MKPTSLVFESGRLTLCFNTMAEATQFIEAQSPNKDWRALWTLPAGGCAMVEHPDVLNRGGAMNKFEVIAIERASTRFSRHGIARKAGGRELHREVFEFPGTPYYLAAEMVRDEFPGAEIVVRSLDGVNPR